MEDTFQEHLKNLNDSFMNEQDQLKRKHDEQKMVACTKAPSIPLIFKFSCVLLNASPLIKCLHVMINIIYPPFSSFIMLSRKVDVVFDGYLNFFSILAHVFEDIEHAMSTR